METSRYKSPGNIKLSEDELLRYNRQIIIPSIGEEGQKKLKNSKVFIAGLGGLGSISSFYLAAAGIGHLKLVDKERVEITNLNRQIVHWSDDIGKKKSLSAIKKLKRLNPMCNIESVQKEINEHTISDLVDDCCVIVDATDNLETRRILNRISLKKDIPFIYGGIDEFNGMVTTFIPHVTGCFECIFQGSHPKKGPIGVIGPIPGIIASIQATEAIKVILGMEGTLKGRLLYFSGVDMVFKEIKIERNPECPVCADYWR